MDRIRKIRLGLGLLLSIGSEVSSAKAILGNFKRTAAFNGYIIQTKGKRVMSRSASDKMGENMSPKTLELFREVLQAAW